jgi:hypothetical protein
LKIILRYLAGVTGHSANEKCGGKKSGVLFRNAKFEGMLCREVAIFLCRNINSEDSYSSEKHQCWR